jgi:hypothetical protein
MNTTTRRLLGGLATAAVLLFGQGGLAHAASPSVAPAPSGPTGNEMLSVQPSIISVSVKPGGSTSAQLTLRAAVALDLTIKSQGLAQATDGSFKSVADTDDTSPYSARTMVTASPRSVHIQPGDTVKLDVNIAVPADVGDGTRYAVVTITGQPATASPSASANVGFAVELGASAIVQISGTTQNRVGTIKTISVGQALPGQPLPVSVSFLNTGDTHYGAQPDELQTTGTLQDATGAVLATSSADGNNLSVIPTFSRDIALPMTPAKPLVDGEKYHIEVGVGLKDGTVLDRKTLDFTWSGGQAVGGAPAPVQTASNDTGLIIAGVALGAAAVILLLVLLPRLLKRRPGGTPS